VFAIDLLGASHDSLGSRSLILCLVRHHASCHDHSGVLAGSTCERTSLDLDGWAGKYSHDTDTNGRTLFQIPAVQAALSHLLTKQDLKRLTETYSVSAPVSLIQDFLIVPQCMPHCCPCEHAMLVIDLPRGVFRVGFYKRESEKVTIQWFSSEGEFQALPKEIQDEFYYSHNPK
jgi:hypothetical protein